MSTAAMPKPDPHMCFIDESDLDHGVHYAQCGPAVLACREKEDGSLWVDNDEYESRVNYCPFCGFQARQPLCRDFEESLVVVRL
jgi:hypothetical protein